MKPVPFAEQNAVLGAPSGYDREPRIGTLPIHTDGEYCLSCWRPSWWERLAILFFGRVWLWVLSGRTQPPVNVTARRPFGAGRG